VRFSVLVLAAAATFAFGCEPPPTDQVAEPAPADTTPPVRTRLASDPFDGCYYQGQRFSLGAVRAQDGVLKKCVEESTWHNVDGFGNLIPEDPSVQDTLSPPDTTATTTEPAAD
jgi:hypothetical protein